MRRTYQEQQRRLGAYFKFKWPWRGGTRVGTAWPAIGDAKDEEDTSPLQTQMPPSECALLMAAVMHALALTMLCWPGM